MIHRKLEFLIDYRIMNDKKEKVFEGYKIQKDGIDRIPISDKGFLIFITPSSYEITYNYVPSHKDEKECRTYTDKEAFTILQERVLSEYEEKISAYVREKDYIAAIEF